MSTVHADPALIVTFGNTTRRERPLTKPTTIVGRGRGCDISLDNPDVASFHCLITRVPEGLLVRDCQSRSGTLVNDRPIHEETLVRGGDSLQIGPFSFRVEIPEAYFSAFPSSENGHSDNGHAALGHFVDPDLLEAARVALESRQEELNDREQRLVSRELELRQQLASADATLTAATEPFAPSTTGIDESVLTALQSRIDELESQLLAATAPPTVDEALPNDVDALKAMVARLQQGQQELTRQLEEAAMAAVANDAALDQELTLAEELGSLNEQCEAAAQRAAEAEAEAAELRRELEIYRGQANSEGGISAQAVDLQRRLQDAETQLADLRQTAAQTAQRADTAESRIQSLKDELQREREQVKQLAQEAAANYAQSAKEIARLQGELANPIGTVDYAEVADLHAQISHLKQQLSDLGASDLQAYEAQLQEYREQLEAAQHELHTQQDHLNDQIRQAEMQMSRERAEMARERAFAHRRRREFRQELDHALREVTVLRQLGPVQALKNEMRGQSGGGRTVMSADAVAKELAERIQQILAQLDQAENGQLSGPPMG